MKVLDWLLLRSSEFKTILKDSKTHKNNTKNSFRKVKRDNILIVKKLRQHEDKLMRLNKEISNIKGNTIKIYKKK